MDWNRQGKDPGRPVLGGANSLPGHPPLRSSRSLVVAEEGFEPPTRGL